MEPIDGLNKLCFDATRSSYGPFLEITSYKLRIQVVKVVVQHEIMSFMALNP